MLFPSIPYLLFLFSLSLVDATSHNQPAMSSVFSAMLNLATSGVAPIGGGASSSSSSSLPLPPPPTIKNSISLYPSKKAVKGDIAKINGVHSSMGSPLPATQHDPSHLNQQSMASLASLPSRVSSAQQPSVVLAVSTPPSCPPPLSLVGTGAGKVGGEELGFSVPTPSSPYQGQQGK